MRFILAAALLTLAAPAWAGTLQEVTTHGIVISVQGQEIEVNYTPDGKFTALGGQVFGTWRIDGDKLCTASNFDQNETCVEYPKDKKPGDSFEVTGPQGSATIRIRDGAPGAPPQSAPPPGAPPQNAPPRP